MMISWNILLKCFKKLNIIMKSLFHHTELSLGPNIKEFWNFVNNRRGNNNLPLIMTYGGHSEEMGKGVADLFEFRVRGLYCSTAWWRIFEFCPP